MLALLISQYDATRQVMTCVYGWERGQLLDIAQFPPTPLEPLGYGVQSESIHMRQPVIVTDLPARLKRARTSLVIGEEALSAIYVPLLAKGEVIGVVQVQSNAYNRFSSEDAEVLSLLAGTTAIAIQNARFFEAERQQRVRAEALAQLAMHLNAQFELDAVLHITCAEIGARFECAGRQHLSLRRRSKRPDFLRRLWLAGLLRPVRHTHAARDF